jgi:dimethylhistidine N-methyltransferase
MRSLPRPVAYAPVDISAEHLHRSAASLAAQFPEVEVRPVAADFSEPFDLPECSIEVRRRVVYFPGSTIGNFEPPAAHQLLQRIGECCGKTGALLIGVDLKKDPARLNAAYNDTAGLTSAFNLNLLTRINRELEANFDLTAFDHRAAFHADLGRVEMHLVSRRKQSVRIAGEVISFQEGESIHTENSYKYTVSEFRDLADQAGFRLVQVWMDAESLFSVHLYERAVSRLSRPGRVG